MKHTILVVEDEEDLREIMRQVLERSGYAVVTAGDGQEALEVLPRIERLGLVILDLLMPRMDGWQFYAELRRQQTRASVPVLVHTSSPSEAPSGVDGVLKKPVSVVFLLAAVHKHCAA